MYNKTKFRTLLAERMRRNGKVMEYVISIDLGATNLRVGIVSSELEIIKVNRERTCKNDKTSKYRIC